MPSSSFIRSVSVFFAVSALTPASLNAAFCAVDVPMLTSCITQPRSGDIIITQNASMTMTDTVSVMSLTPLTWRRCFLCLDLRRREVRLVSALPLISFSFVSSSAKTAASFHFSYSHYSFFSSNLSTYRAFSAASGVDFCVLLLYNYFIMPTEVLIWTSTDPMFSSHSCWCFS